MTDIKPVDEVAREIIESEHRKGVLIHEVAQAITDARREVAEAAARIVEEESADPAFIEYGAAKIRELARARVECTAHPRTGCPHPEFCESKCTGNPFSCKESSLLAWGLHLLQTSNSSGTEQK